MATNWGEINPTFKGLFYSTYNWYLDVRLEVKNDSLVSWLISPT